MLIVVGLLVALAGCDKENSGNPPEASPSQVPEVSAKDSGESPKDAHAASIEKLWPNLKQLAKPVIELDEDFSKVDLNSTPEPCGSKWTNSKTWFNSGNISSVEDGEAPASPIKVLKYRFEKGRKGGGSPARAVNFGSKAYKHRYIGFYVRWSIPWDEHKVLDKIIYWGEEDRRKAGGNPAQFFVFRKKGVIKAILQYAQNYEGQPYKKDAHSNASPVWRRRETPGLNAR